MSAQTDEQTTLRSEFNFRQLTLSMGAIGITFTVLAVFAPGFLITVSVVAIVSLPVAGAHVLSKDEAKFVFERGCEQLILGSGQMGNVHLSPEAEAYFAKKGCKVQLQPTPEAIGVFNRSHAKKIGLFHVTC